MSSVNAGSPITPGLTAVAVVTDATFTNAATATLIDGALSQVQAKTFVDGTHFTINTVVQGEIRFGARVLRITEGATTENIPVVLNPITNNAYTNIVTPDISEYSIFYNYAAYASIVQVEYTQADNVYQIQLPNEAAQNTLIYADGTFRVQRDIPSFQVRLHDGVSWSTFTDLTLNEDDAVTPPTFPDFCRSTSHQTLWQKFNNLHPYKYRRAIYSRPSFSVPVARVGDLISAMCKDPDLHTRATTVVPSREFFSVLRNGVTFRLFDITKLRDRKQQVNVTFNLGAGQADVTRYEYKFRFENEFWMQEDPIISNRTPRSYFLETGEFYTVPESNQNTLNFVAGGPPVKLSFNIIDNQYVIQPFYSEAPQRDFSKWVKFKNGQWVGVVMVTRWSRTHGGWHAVYINGIKLYETQGGGLPSAAQVFFKLGLNAYTLAWSRRSISFKDVRIAPNPATLLP